MALKKQSLKLAWFYPDLMSTYGDYGNVVVLKSRAAWAGIDLEVVKIDVEDMILPKTKVDLIFMGGAQDRQQSIVSKDFTENKKNFIKDQIERGVPGLFICGAYQLMGDYYMTAEGEAIEGLKIFDLHTEHLITTSTRLVGKVIIESPTFPGMQIVGFENHGGRTYLGNRNRPFGKVIVGFGNNGEDSGEGVSYKNAIGTYLHGPILPANPSIADWLIGTALEVKYGHKTHLTFPAEDLEKKIREEQS